MDQIKPVDSKLLRFFKWGFVKIIVILAFLEYLDFDAKIKIHLFRFRERCSSEQVLRVTLMEKFKLAVVKKFEFGKLDVNIDNSSGNFNWLRIGRKEKTYTPHFNDRLRVQTSEKDKEVLFGSFIITFPTEPWCFTDLTTL